MPSPLDVSMTRTPVVKAAQSGGGIGPLEGRGTLPRVTYLVEGVFNDGDRQTPRRHHDSEEETSVEHLTCTTRSAWRDERHGMESMHTTTWKYWS